MEGIKELFRLRLAQHKASQQRMETKLETAITIGDVERGSSKHMRLEMIVAEHLDKISELEKAIDDLY